MLLHQAGGGWSTWSSLPWPSVISQDNGRKGSVLGRQNLESRSVGPQPEHPPPPAGELFCKGRGEAQAPPPHACALCRPIGAAPSQERPVASRLSRGPERSIAYAVWGSKFWDCGEEHTLCGWRMEGGRDRQRDPRWGQRDTQGGQRHHVTVSRAGGRAAPSSQTWRNQGMGLWQPGWPLRQCPQGFPSASSRAEGGPRGLGQQAGFGESCRFPQPWRVSEGGQASSTQVCPSCPITRQKEWASALRSSWGPDGVSGRPPTLLCLDRCWTVYSPPLWRYMQVCSACDRASLSNTWSLGTQGTGVSLCPQVGFWHSVLRGSWQSDVHGQHGAVRGGAGARPPSQRRGEGVMITACVISSWSNKRQENTHTLVCHGWSMPAVTRWPCANLCLYICAPRVQSCCLYLGRHE